LALFSKSGFFVGKKSSEKNTIANVCERVKDHSNQRTRYKIHKKRKKEKDDKTLRGHLEKCGEKSEKSANLAEKCEKL